MVTLNYSHKNVEGEDYNLDVTVDTKLKIEHNGFAMSVTAKKLRALGEADDPAGELKLLVQKKLKYKGKSKPFDEKVFDEMVEKFIEILDEVQQ